VYSLAGFGRMVTDNIRTDSYAQALKREIRIGGVVADIGTGPGILALLACRFGARRVYAFEPSGVIELAREIAAANGFADRIEFVPKKSTESSLPERVDTIVSDIRGILPFFGQSLVSIIDARERFLATNGRMIPSSDTLWIAGVQAPEFYQEQLGPWNDRPYDFDMSAAHLRTVNSISQYWVTTEQIFLEPRCLTTLDYMTLKQTALDATVSWTVNRASRGHGVVLWFDSVLADGVTLTNRPGAPRLIYKQAFFPWPSPLDVCPGDTVTVTVSARLVGSEYVWRWDTHLKSKSTFNGAKPPFRQSTFFGSDLSPADLWPSSSQFQPELNEDGQIHHRILSLMQGTTSLEAISREVVKDFPNQFKRWQDAFNLVSSISRKFGSGTH
jgi:protein arginine N-methyltransferase 1